MTIIIQAILWAAVLAITAAIALGWGKTFSDAELADIRAWLDSKPRDVESLAQRLLATIDALTEERDRLRAALQGIVTAIDNHHPKYKYGPFTLTRTEIDAARAAMEGQE